jgi:hypothetical protein
LSFKCFNCEKVGQCVAKFPYEKNKISDSEENYNVKNKHRPHKNIHKQDKHEKNNNSYKYKKSLYSKGVSDLSEENSESDVNSDR